MEWFRIAKESSVQPPNGRYTDWKPMLAEEAKQQCVYCAIHEAQFGGTRNYHVEHYRPKSRLEFAHLENDIANLFYSCCICNCFKGNDWPSEPRPDNNTSAYPDPSIVNYADIFTVNEVTGIIESDFVAGKYLINKLYLNRPQLIMERRVYFMFARLADFRGVCENAIPVLEGDDTSGSKDLLSEIAKAMISIDRMKDRLRNIAPYRQGDIQRP